MRTPILVAAALLSVSVTASAQPAHSTARWQAWYGCWRSVPHDSLGTPTPERSICMVPTSSADAVEIVALDRGTVVHRDTIDASGVLRQVSSDGCKGSESAQWSADGRRVFRQSLATCGGAVIKSTSILTMTPFGEWIDIRSANAAGNTIVNVARYRDAGIPATTPPEIVDAVRGYAPNIDAARLVTSAPIPPAAVIEASKLVDNTVLEAWVGQAGLPFLTDSKSLTQLADAGIAPKVTDTMVSVEANSRDSYDAWVSGYKWDREAGSYWDQGTGMRVWFTDTDPWSYGFGSMWRYGRGYQRYAYGTNNWGWLTGSGVFASYDPWAYGSNASNSVGSLLPPTVVLHQDPTNGAARAKAGSASKDNGENDKTPSDGILSDVIKKVTGSGSSKSPPPAPSKP